MELTPTVSTPLVELIKGVKFPEKIPEKAPIMKVSKYNLSIVIDESRLVLGYAPMNHPREGMTSKATTKDINQKLADDLILWKLKTA